MKRRASFFICSCPLMMLRPSLAFYMYGELFKRMKHLLSGFIASYPLCAACRIERIA